MAFPSARLPKAAAERLLAAAGAKLEDIKAGESVVAWRSIDRSGGTIESDSLICLLEQFIQSNCG